MWPGTIPVGDYVVITPYLIPSYLSKTINIGDGFIMDSSVKLIGAQPKAMISSRAPLTEDDLAVINASRCVIAMGANTLKDIFEITPKFGLATMRRIKVPVILMGLGHYGTAEHTKGLLPASIALLEAVLERFPYMSVRCDQSHRYVTSAIPKRLDQVLMTSCPVVYPVDEVDGGFADKPVYERMVVTLTDRADLPSQLPLLDLARAAFPARRRILALHQDQHNEALWAFAETRGYEIFRSGDYRDYVDLYRDTDLHIGNRVHAHLKCLSMGQRSFLTPFDLRHLYFAQSLDFALTDPRGLNDVRHQDFGAPMQAVARSRGRMDTFIGAIREQLA